MKFIKLCFVDCHSVASLFEFAVSEVLVHAEQVVCGRAVVVRVLAQAFLNVYDWESQPGCIVYDVVVCINNGIRMD